MTCPTNKTLFENARPVGYKGFQGDRKYQTTVLIPFQELDN